MQHKHSWCVHMQTECSEYYIKDCPWRDSLLIRWSVMICSVMSMMNELCQIVRVGGRMMENNRKYIFWIRRKIVCSFLWFAVLLWRHSKCSESGIYDLFARVWCSVTCVVVNSISGLVLLMKQVWQSIYCFKRSKPCHYC